jgi:succinate dehydrogenase hydrophobic anchor subunit
MSSLSRERTADVIDDLGVRRNARLTALTGSVLLVLLFLEGVTVLQVGSLIVPHMVIGAALLAPVLLKLSTTGWKILRYYTRSPEYVREGPPPLLRRLLAPVVMVTTVGLLGTGVVLMLDGPSASSRWTFLHKGFFVVWFAAMTVHVLVHVGRTVRAVTLEYVARRPDALPGRGVRLLALAGMLLLGTGLASWATGFTGPWTALFHG